MQSQGSIRTVDDKFLQAVASAVACQDGKIGQVMLLDAYYTSKRIQRIIHHACDRFHISSSYFDDIRQELALLLIQRFLEQREGQEELYLRDAEKVYNVLHRTAFHLARRRAEKSSEVSFSALGADDGADEEALSALIDSKQTAFDDVPQVEADIDQAKAKDEFRRRFDQQFTKGAHQDMQLTHHLFINPQRQQIVVSSSSTKAPAPRVAGEDSPEMIELRTIMHALDLTIPEMAAVLNITKGKFNSYLYGIVKKVPLKVMVEARQLLEVGAPEVEAIRRKFDHLKMAQIIDAWTDQLKAVSDPSDHGELQKIIQDILKVDRATMWRWLQEKMRPRPRALKDYDAAVSEFVSKVTA